MRGGDAGDVGGGAVGGGGGGGGSPPARGPRSLADLVPDPASGAGVTCRLPTERPRSLTRLPLRRVESPTDGAVALLVETRGDEPFLGRWIVEVAPDGIIVYRTDPVRLAPDDQSAWVANLAAVQISLGEYDETLGPIGVQVCEGRLALDTDPPASVAATSPAAPEAAAPAPSAPLPDGGWGVAPFLFTDTQP